MPKDQSQSPNLLSDTPYKEIAVTKAQPAIIIISKTLIIIVEAALIIALAINLKLESDIKILQESIDNAYYSITQKQEIEQLARDTLNRTKLYHTFESQRTEVGGKTELLLNNIPPELTLRSIKIEPSSAELTVEAESALSFTKLITKYFEIGLAREIVLHSAFLKSSTDIFVLDLEVTYGL
jgi:hypothetical protein